MFSLMPLGQTAIPMIAVLIASFLMISYRPQGLWLNAIRVFAGGTLLAVIAQDLLPQLQITLYPTQIIGAMVLALLVMAGLNQINSSCCSHSEPSTPLSTFIIAFGLEFFINGLLIAFASLSTPMTGWLIAISLAMCCFSCGMAVASRLAAASWTRLSMSLTMVALAILFPIGAVIAMLFLNHISMRWYDAILAFSMTILLYITSVDLITPGFKQPHFRLKIIFFTAFIVFIAITAFKGTGATSL